MKNIVVFFGGNSVEHDVSVITGVMTVNSLNKERFNAVPVYVTKNNVFYTGEKLKDISVYKDFDDKNLSKAVFVPSENRLYILRKNKLKKLCEISAVINCMHGENGEDGSLAGFLKFFSLPLASPDVLPSAIAQDKCVTKLALKGLNVPVLPYVDYKDGEILLAERKVGYPMIVKPARLGSSIGITLAKNRAELESAIYLSKKYDNKILVEKYLQSFTEINCAVYKTTDGIKVSLLESPKTKNGILTYSDKYEDGEREFPAKIGKALTDKIQNLSAKIYGALFDNGVIRIDFLINESQVFVNEINAVPGSLAYYLFAETEEEFSLMLDEIISSSLEDFNKRQSLIKNFSNNVLNIKSAKGGKRL